MYIHYAMFQHCNLIDSLTLLMISDTLSILSHLSSSRLKVVNVTTVTKTKIRYAPTIILSHIL